MKERVFFKGYLFQEEEVSPTLKEISISLMMDF